MYSTAAEFSIFLFSLIRDGKTAVKTAHFQRCRLRFFRSQECGTVQRSRLLIFRSLRGRGRRCLFRLLGLARFWGQDEILDVDAGGPSLALLLPLDQADTVLVQFPEQLRGLVLPAAHKVHGVLLGEINVNAPVAVHPAVFDGQPHAVQQEAVEDLGLNGNALIPGVGQQGLGDSVKAVLFRFVAVVVVQIQI